MSMALAYIRSLRVAVMASLHCLHILGASLVCSQVFTALAVSMLQVKP